MRSSSAFVGIDVGGTFTDLAMFDAATRQFSTVKVPSSPPLFWPSVIDALDKAGIDSQRDATILHGTTVHLNAFLERKGARMALVTTGGFRDVYEMRRGNRPQPYDMHFRYPTPLVARRDIFELAERVGADGTILTAIDPDEVRALAQRLRAGDYQAVAICFLHSYRNPANEAAVAELLRAELPGMLVAPSHEVCREWREYERTSTAVINAYASPVLKRYLTDLLGALEQKAESRLFLLQSNGGLMRAEGAGDRGILSLLSGPVGGNVAGRALSQVAGMPNLICIDMGGTSFEASLVIDGESVVRNEREVGGFPILTPMVDIHTIGAGGGSIAWNDAGALRVGPQSAGARPGPASYGHGGAQPTVTDANIALGRLEDGCAFGDLRLDAGLARAAIAGFAEDFGLSGEAMAQGILDVINEQMANAIRTITVRRGIDPRSFVLVAYGGAGPMHAADIARLLGIGTIVVPRAAGAFSAWGMLQSDLVHDRAETILVPAAELDWAALDARYAALEAELAATLVEEGVAQDRIQFTRSFDVRYLGQEQGIGVRVDAGSFADAAGRDARLRTDFERAYADIFGHINDDEALEVATVRLRASGRTGLDAQTLIMAESAPEADGKGERTLTVRFDGADRDTRFLPRAAMVPGERVAGPCVVEEQTCTTIVPPDFSATIDPIGNLVLTFEGAAA
ncbi:hydantoinase/oxoprolinase family protein [Sphingomonas colocasiae]|uniref:Hydantoinase/oxoprolinase family protein n=1 Tax=Sphingomonas colocasiae TaxID=1848973 RepID=A0ABS7PXD2_9SPHN|nr:hydantoinase/oxoprolinase family protein [Sphingomonas colocasiae]MBY8825002.1 hydantoinase/oxoprolinase family protein [Sphingomonas colocasiae]